MPALRRIPSDSVGYLDLFKGRHNDPDGHYLDYYADVGGGGSSLTWQAAANFSYDYKKFTGIVGYR